MTWKDHNKFRVPNMTTTVHSVHSQDPETGTWSIHDAFILPWNTRIRPGGWSREELVPYRKYTKLFGERKYAQNYPTKPFPLMELPPEIRNRIYREYLVLHTPIDLCPKATGFKGNVHAWRHHIRRWKKDICPRLRLLRTNKQVLAETRSIFYAENEFRFTNSKAWYVLDAFLYTIGQQNTAWLRHLAIHVPWAGTVNDNNYDNLPESHATMNWMMNRFDKMGLRYHKRWNRFTECKAVTRCQTKLEAASGLKSLKLVLPDSYELLNEHSPHQWVGCRVLSVVLNPQRFGNLQVGLYILSGASEGDRYDEYKSQEYRQLVLGSHMRAMGFAAEQEWSVQSVMYDAKGHWPLQYYPLTVFRRPSDESGEDGGW